MKLNLATSNYLSLGSQVLTIARNWWYLKADTELKANQVPTGVSRCCLLIGIILILSKSLLAQSPYVPSNELHYHWLDRFDLIFSNPTNLHLSVKKVQRKDVAEMLHAIDSLNSTIGVQDLSDMQRLIDLSNEYQHSIYLDQQVKSFVDSTKLFYTYSDPINRKLKYNISKRPFLKHFYKTPSQFFEVNSPDFKLRINPLLNFRLSNAGNGDVLFENQRGIAIRGAVDGKVYFHTEILESQARFSEYVNRFRNKFGAVPGAGFYKSYESSIFDFDNGVDYLLANAYVGTSISRHVQLEFGHGRHFIGNGIRSLFLSDFTTDYFYLKLNTRVWKFHYQNIFGELLQERRSTRDQLLPKKYFAAHYLSLNILKNLYIGLFETVVFAREDQFELQYLNPVILYRTVEGSLGSPDNVLLGLDIKYNLWRRVSIYSQIILDEFKISEVRAGNGWWANKYSFQIGVKTIDLFRISHLDAQLEYNVARPYTYSHREGIAHYSHYKQSLAHPLGANFRESLLQINYQPSERWFITARVINMDIGEDQDTLNWGSNILLANDDRVQDFGNKITQGVHAKIRMLGIDVSFQIKQGFFLDAFYQYRNKVSDLNERNQKDNYLGIGLRWNLGRKWLQF